MKHSLVSSLVHNFSGQLISRAISFLINMYLLRRIDGDVLGFVNVRLMLFYTTNIFLIREPFRKAFLSSNATYAIIFSHSWIAPLVCPVIGLLLYLCLWMPLSTHPPSSISPSYSLPLAAFGFAAWLESLAEPYVILSLKLSMDAQYAITQGLLVVLQRSLALTLFATTQLQPVYIFCCAQILSSLIYLLICVYLLVRKLRDMRSEGIGLYSVSLLPALPSVLSRGEISLLGTFAVHSVFKQILTDGTSYVLTFTSQFPLSEQAVFDAIDKLGGLIARIFFAPLEHSAYLYFSAFLSRSSSEQKHTKMDMKKALESLTDLLHIVVMSGVVVLVFVIPYATLVISIYGGDFLVTHSGAGIFRLYSVYIVVIAVNGITECFTMVTMSKAELFSHGWYLFFSSPIHIALSLIFSFFIGVYGLILANIINMLLRIMYSLRHIRHFLLGQFNLRKIFPGFSTFLVLVLCLIITSISCIIFGGVGGILHNAAHIAVGALLFIFAANYIYQNDIQVAKFIKKQFQSFSYNKGI